MLHECNKQFRHVCKMHSNIYVTCMLLMHAIFMCLACYTYVAYMMHTYSAYVTCMSHVCNMHVFFSRALRCKNVLKLLKNVIFHFTCVIRLSRLWNILSRIITEYQKVFKILDLYVAKKCQNV